jgi:PAS domain S-box-containing protein
MHPTSINPPDQSPPDLAQLKPEACSDVIWHSPLGIFTSTPDGRYTFVNPAAARIYGYPSPAELIASISDISSQIYADPTERETFQRQLREEGELVNHEYQHRRRDGSVFWVSLNARAIFDEHRELLHYQGFISDITERKWMDEVLRESEQRHRILFEEALNPIFLVDENGLYVDANDAALQFMECEREKLMGRSVWDFAPPAIIDRQKQEHSPFSKKRMLETDYLIEGKIKTLLLNVVPLKAGGRKVLCGIGQDVTERKQAEEQLQKSEQEFRDLYDEAPVGYFEYDLRGNITRVNHTLLKSLGYTTKEMIGQPCWKFIVDEVAREQIMAKLDGVRPPAVGLERTYRRKDGTTFPVLFEDRLLLDEDGHIKGIRTAIQDITERKQVEEALKESEERYNLAMDASRDGVYEWDLETREIYYSPGWKRMLGYEPDELPDDFSIWEKLTRPEDVEKSWQMMNELIEGKRDRFEMEFQMQHKDGHWIHILSRSNIYKDANGKLARVVGTHVDVTDSIHLRERLRLNDSRYKKAQEMGKVGNWEYNLYTGHFWGSDEAKRIYGFDPKQETFSREAVESCIPEREKVDQALIDLIEKGTEYNLEFQIFPLNSKQPKTVISLAELHKNDKGLPMTVYGVVQDITERKRAEELLVRQQRSLKLSNRIANIFLTSSRKEIFADVLDVILKDLDSRFGYFGYIDEAGDLVCPSMTCDVWEQCQTPEKSVVFPRSSWGGLWGQSLLEKQTVIANENLQLPEGHVTLENALAVPIVYADNLIGQFVLANKAGGYDKHDRELLENTAAQTAPILFAVQEEARQRTEHEKLEKQLRQAQKMESVGRLAGGVAHDFNNMLGVILGHTEMALDDVDPEAPLHANLQAIHYAAERSAALTRQLLAFARKQTIAPKIINLNETVAGMLNMLRRLIGEDIDLLWQPGKNLPSVKVDPAQIDQLLANLCVNARDAIKGVGKITIETASAIFDEAYCAAHHGFLPGEYTLLAVSDDGCGMDKKTLNQIFEPFFTTKEQGKGTGLGLASVFGMVKQNKGFINVYIEPGQGTTFKIYLPAYEVKSGRMAEKLPELPLEGGNQTILLVEDEPAILQMTTMMLERLGYTVVPASTPGEAIRLALEYRGRIDLLMTDVVMPEMNGRDLAGNLLSHYPDLKRLFMSGYTANVIAHHGVLDPGINFIQKPFAMKELASKVRKALDEI